MDLLAAAPLSGQATSALTHFGPTLPSYTQLWIRVVFQLDNISLPYNITRLLLVDLGLKGFGFGEGIHVSCKRERGTLFIEASTLKVGQCYS